MATQNSAGVFAVPDSGASTTISVTVELFVHPFASADRRSPQSAARKRSDFLAANRASKSADRLAVRCAHRPEQRPADPGVS